MLGYWVFPQSGPCSRCSLVPWLKPAPWPPPVKCTWTSDIPNVSNFKWLTLHDRILYTTNFTLPQTLYESKFYLVSRQSYSKWLSYFIQSRNRAWILSFKSKFFWSKKKSQQSAPIIRTKVQTTINTPWSSYWNEPFSDCPLCACQALVQSLTYLLQWCIAKVVGWASRVRLPVVALFILNHQSTLLV